MDHKSPNKTIFSVGACLYVAFATAVAQQQGADHLTKLWGYEFERTAAAQEVYYLDYSSSSERIEITVVSRIGRQTAEEMIKEKLFQFGALFEKQRVGYPGQHTEYIECKPEFKPTYSQRQIEGGLLRYFEGFASDRFIFGACDEQSAVYPAISAYVYCDAVKTMYDIDYFSMSEDEFPPSGFIDRIRCQ